MKYVVGAVFLLSFGVAKANFICDLFLKKPEMSFNLTERATELKDSTAEEIIGLDSGKTWIFTRHKENRAYKYIPGRNGKPLYIFLMGLGGSIEETEEKNLVVQGYIKKGHPVLLLEGSKLGDTSILAQKTKFNTDFKQNMEGFEDLIKVFFEENSLLFSDIIIAGHSYGAYGAGHLAHKIQDLVSAFSNENSGFKLTLQLFAPAVTNFNNRFNPNWLNSLFGGIANYMDMVSTNSGYNLQVKEVKKSMLGSMPELETDPIKLSMSAELTVDAGDVYLLDSLKMIPKDTQVQLIIASEEGFLFPMMHLELYQDLQKLQIETLIFEIEGPDHFVTDKLSKKQVNALVNLKPNSDFESRNSYYLVSSNGRKNIGNISDLETILKQRTLNMWNHFIDTQNVRKEVQSLYPKEWR